MTNSLEAYKTKIFQLLFGSAIFGIGLTVLRRTLATGSSKNLYIVAVLTVVAALILALDRYYWTLGCFLMFLVVVPHMKVRGLELGAAVLVCMYFLQSVFHRDSVPKPDFPVFTTLFPYLFWVGMCFAMNPCGLYILGSTSIGFRFYVTLVIGLAAMFVLSRTSISEKDAKILFWVAMSGSFSYLFLNAKILGGIVSGDAFDDTLHYEYTQMRFVAMLLLCRYTFSKILSDWRLFVSVGVLLLLCIYTGNRTTGMTPLVCATLLPWLRRKERRLFAVVAVFGAVGLIFLVAGQGRLYQLPQGIQKSLSYLPAKWDDQWKNYGFRDVFRDELRALAKESIRANPWTGRKGFAMNLENAAWIFSTSRNNSGHAFSGNWHNLWLGMAADFGVPCSFFFAMFYFFATLHAYKQIKFFKPGSWLETMYLFMFMRLFLVFLTSLGDGGHSAKSPQETFLWFGFCLALINGRKAQHRAGSEVTGAVVPQFIQR